MLGLARAVPKIALHYKVSGIGRFRLPTPLANLLQRSQEWWFSATADFDYSP
jgi:hypothetical protein